MTFACDPLFSVDQARAALSGVTDIDVRSLPLNHPSRRRLIEAALLCVEECLVDLANQSPATAAPDPAHPDTVITLVVKPSTSLPDLSEFGSGIGQLTRLTGKKSHVAVSIAGPARENPFANQEAPMLSLGAPVETLKLPSVLIKAFQDGEVTAAIEGLFPKTDQFIKPTIQPWETHWPAIIDSWASGEPDNSERFSVWEAECREHQLEQSLPSAEASFRKGPRL